MKDKYFDQIEKYFSKEGPETERQAFEQDLAQNKALKKEMEMHQVAQNSLERLVETDLRDTFSNWKKEGQKAVPQRQASIRPLIYRLSIAASILIIIGVATWQWKVPAYSNDALLATYYHPLEFQTLRSAAPSAKTDFAKAKSAIDQGDLDTAIPFFSIVSDTSSRYLEARYYLAHAFYQDQQFEAAIPVFEEIEKSGDTRFSEKAEWYGLLSQLAGKQTDAVFFDKLNRLAQNVNHSYHAQAVDLQEKLNSFWRRLVR